MNKTRSLLTILGMFLYQFQVSAQTPNYSGTWRLNFEKSKLEQRPNGLTSTVFLVEQEGEKFSLTRYHIFGDKKNKISFKMVSNGNTKRIKLLFKGKLQRTENGLIATLWRKNFSNVVHYKFGSSQNEFIADEVFTSRSSNHHNIWVFDKETSR